VSPDRGVLAPPTKCCRRCACVKPTSEFFRRRNAPDERSSYCKSCTADATRTSRDRRKSALRVAAEARAHELISGGRPIDYANESIEVRTAILELLDIPGRSVYGIAVRAGCSPSTVYRRRRLADADSL